MLKRALLSNGGWLLRVVTVTALVVVISLSLLPRFTSHISTSAVVNAPVVIIRSPVEGVVENYRFETAAMVSPGEELLVFREMGTDLSAQADIQARLSMSQAAAEAVRKRIATIEALRKDLILRHETYLKWQQAILEREVEALDAEQREARQRLEALTLEADRRRTLRDRATVAENTYQEIEYQRRAQVERILALQAHRDVRQLKLQALKDGILAGTDGSNTQYTLQRQDEARLEIAALDDELRDHLAETEALSVQLEVQRQIFARENRIAVASPVSGVVWRSAASDERPVLPGDEVVELLDCNARFLEAYLPEALMDTIQLGDLADVKLTGDSNSFRAPIVSILGHGARYNHVELAAQDDAPKKGKMRVIIDLNRSGLARDPHRFCHVGRTAQVSFPRDLSTFARFGSEISLTIAQWMHPTSSLTR